MRRNESSENRETRQHRRKAATFLLTLIAFISLVLGQALPATVATVAFAEIIDEGEPVLVTEETNPDLIVPLTFYDNEDTYGMRPDSVIVRLYSSVDGGATWMESDARAVDASTDWVADFGSLPSTDGEGNPLSYKVEQDPVPYYLTRTTNPRSGSYRIVNHYTAGSPDVLTVDIAQIWDDDHNADGMRPESVSFTLTAWRDGEQIGTVGYPATLTLDDTGDDIDGKQIWTRQAIWAAPAHDSEGNELTYQVTPTAVDGYETGDVQYATVDGVMSATVEFSHHAELPVDETAGDADAPVVRVESANGSVTINPINNPDAVYKVYHILDATITTTNGEEQVSGISSADVTTAARLLQFVVERRLAGSSLYDDWKTANGGGADSYTLVSRFIYEVVLPYPDRRAILTDWILNDSTLNSRAASVAGGSAYTNEQGIYLVITNPSSVGNNDAGTTPMWITISDQAKTVDEQSARPALVEQVCEGSTGAWGTIADANVGQDIPYRTTATLPSNYTEFSSYALTITQTLPAGISLVGDESDIVVSIDGHEVDSLLYSGSAMGDITISGGQITTTLSDLKGSWGAGITPTNGSTITVEYTGRLNSSATRGTAYNSTSASIAYTADPVSLTPATSATSVANATTYSLTVDKVDEATRHAVEGASFVATTEVGGTTYWLKQDGSLVPSQNLADTLITGNSGSFTITGLDAGTYVLTETSAPDGYREVENAVQVTITSTLDNTTAALTDLDASMTGGDSSRLVSGLTSNANEDGVEFLDTSMGAVGVRISNERATVMPYTGRAGRTLLIVAGSSLGTACLAVVAHQTMERQRAGFPRASR